MTSDNTPQNGGATKLTVESLKEVIEFLEKRVVPFRAITIGSVIVSVPPDIYAKIEATAKERNTTMEHAYWIVVGVME